MSKTSNNNIPDGLRDIVDAIALEFERNISRSDIMHKHAHDYAKETGRCIMVLEYSSLKKILNSVESVYVILPLEEALTSCTKKQIEEIQTYDLETEFVLWIKIYYQKTECVHVSKIINKDAYLAVRGTRLSDESRAIIVRNPDEVDEIAMDMNQCTFCQKVSRKLSLCSRCRSAVYCDVECQRANWNDHRQFCDSHQIK